MQQKVNTHTVKLSKLLFETLLRHATEDMNQNADLFCYSSNPSRGLSDVAGYGCITDVASSK